jgi:hypothetical protein
VRYYRHRRGRSRMTKANPLIGDAIVRRCRITKRIGKVPEVGLATSRP